MLLSKEFDVILFNIIDLKIRPWLVRFVLLKSLFWAKSEIAAGDNVDELTMI